MWLEEMVRAHGGGAAPLGWKAMVVLGLGCGANSAPSVLSPCVASGEGEWVGNGCMCTPACYRMRIGKSMCGSTNLCFYPGICGCGPSCPEPCGTDFMPCPMMGEDVYCNCGNFVKFKDNSTLEPACCGCGRLWLLARLHLHWPVPASSAPIIQ